MEAGAFVYGSIYITVADRLSLLTALRTCLYGLSVLRVIVLGARDGGPELANRLAHSAAYFRQAPDTEDNHDHD